ncbi:restriction endonuclease PLD domain-containing protein [Acinetobacter pittii]|uniref:restriction endonuclease PLD domain-containing protein n=1 Tax=Acinetobacter TaxID=469 RepID=UPI00070D8816|nr:restriction endonuclease PLD domain-containing protein [Acinetobacter pittii]KRI63282.1 NgoFVII family restriction endonuclease [Acinetobacter pittii]
MYSNNLESVVFNRHLGSKADELLIITGYIGPDPFAKLKTLPLDCQVIYGMYGSDSIGEKLHKSLVKINSSLTNTDLFYSQSGVHAKCYLWKKKGIIVDALIGSANFSRNGLATPDREVLVEADPSVFSQLQAYFDKIISNSIHCSSSSVKLKVNNLSARVGVATDCKLSFLTKTRGILEVPAKSGLNWGVNSSKIGGTSHTSVGDAEIRITKKAIQNYPHLFPPKVGTPSKRTGKLQRQNDEIELIWDDGTIMKGLLEQNLTIGDLIYPKAICSSDSKAELGLYLRKRIGVSDTHVITKRDLEKYGRTDVTISLQAEGIYYMDFSV